MPGRGASGRAVTRAQRVRGMTRIPARWPGGSRTVSRSTPRGGSRANPNPVLAVVSRPACSAAHPSRDREQHGRHRVLAARLPILLGDLSAVRHNFEAVSKGSALSELSRRASRDRPLDVLLEQARQEDAAHRVAHQRPISADTLRVRMRIGMDSSKPSTRRECFGTIRGSNSPLRSRGTSIRTDPTSACTVFCDRPLR